MQSLSLRFEPTGRCEWQIDDQPMLPLNTNGRTGRYGLSPNGETLTVTWDLENPNQTPPALHTTVYLLVSRNGRDYLVEDNLLDSLDRQMIEGHPVTYGIRD